MKIARKILIILRELVLITGIIFELILFVKYSTIFNNCTQVTFIRTPDFICGQTQEPLTALVLHLVTSAIAIALLTFAIYYPLRLFKKKV